MILVTEDNCTSHIHIISSKDITHQGMHFEEPHLDCWIEEICDSGTLTRSTFVACWRRIKKSNGQFLWQCANLKVNIGRWFGIHMDACDWQPQKQLFCLNAIQVQYCSCYKLSLYFLVVIHLSKQQHPEVQLEGTNSILLAKSHSFTHWRAWFLCVCKP